MNRWALRAPTETRIGEDIGMAVLARSSGYCEGCNRTERQGIKPHRRGSRAWDWSPANWLHLCPVCRELIKHSRELAIRHGWTLRDEDDPHRVLVLWRNRTSRLTAKGKVEQQRVSEDMAWRAI